jgi:transposase
VCSASPLRAACDAHCSWDKVLFFDEKTFWGSGFCGQVWVRREKGAALDPENCVHKKAHPVKVNVWAAFCARGQGYCHIYSEHLDKHLYKNILAANLLPSAQLHFSLAPPLLEQWYFLQDNAPQHTSRLAKDWLHNKGITCLDFPPYSPDLNPIENLWSAMARAVEVQPADTLEELEAVVAQEWENVDKELMRTLVHSMPRRCQAVIAADGWHTQY